MCSCECVCVLSFAQACVHIRECCVVVLLCVLNWLMYYYHIVVVVNLSSRESIAPVRAVQLKNQYFILFRSFKDADFNQTSQTSKEGVRMRSRSKNKSVTESSTHRTLTSDREHLLSIREHNKTYTKHPYTPLQLYKHQRGYITLHDTCVHMPG